MRLFTILFLALCSLTLSAQTLSTEDKADINTRTSEYFELTKANDYAKMMDYIYPKLFTLAPREQLIEVFNGMEAMGIGLNVDAIAMNKLEPLIERGDKKYAVVVYDVDIRLELLTPNMQSEQVIESLKASFKVSYAATNMSYDEETNTLSFSGHKYVLAIKDPEYDGENWYFLEYDASNPMAAEMLLGNDVLTKFKEKIGQ